MCTVTWLAQPGGYHVFFNRDEKKTRQSALPPSVHLCGNTKYLAPIDADAGGSWLAVNERGLTLGLLNHYPAERPSDSKKISRGQLLISLMDASTGEEVSQRLRDLNLVDYRPFFLVVFEPHQAPVQNLWDGADLKNRSLGDADLPLTTSSFETAGVVDARRETFNRFRGPSVEHFERYHATGNERGGAYGVFMSRPDAETVSYSRVTVGLNRVEFYYAPRTPGSMEFPAGTLYSLARS